MNEAGLVNLVNININLNDKVKLVQPEGSSVTLKNVSLDCNGQIPKKGKIYLYVTRINNKIKQEKILITNIEVGKNEVRLLDLQFNYFDDFLFETEGDDVSICTSFYTKTDPGNIKIIRVKK